MPPSSDPCPRCGAPLRDAALCAVCGTPVEAVEEDVLDVVERVLGAGLGRTEEEPTTDRGVLYLCPACGAFVSGGDAVCGRCRVALVDPGEGGPDAEARLCPHCGEDIHVAAEVCPACGGAVTPASGPEGGSTVLCAECGAASLLGEGRCDVCAAPLSGGYGTADEGRPTQAKERPLEESTAPAPPSPSRASRPPASAGRHGEDGEGARSPARRRPLSIPVASLRPPPRPRDLSRLREGTAYTLGGATLAALLAFALGASGGEWLLFGTSGVGAFSAAVLLARGGRPRHGRTGRIVLAVGSAALVLASVHELLGWPPRDLPAVGALVGLALLAAGLLRVRRGAGTALPWLAGSLVLFLGAAGPLGGLRVEGEAISVVRLAGALAVAAPLALFGHDRWVRHRIQARLVYGDARYDRRDVEASLAAYDRAATLAARAGVAEETPWCSKGAALVLLGRYEKALESLDTALRINPYHEVAWVNKGNALAKLGRPMDALRCYNSAIKVNPRYEVAWNNKGNALARLGRYGEALKAYEKALAIDPGYRGAWVNKGYVLAKLGRYDEAARCADRVLALPTAATPDG